MTTETEKPWPYIKFRVMKTFRTSNGDLNGETKPTDYYLRVDGVHKHLGNVNQHEQRGAMIVGYGNLEGPQFAELRTTCDQRMGVGQSTALYKSVMDERVQKAKDARSKQA